MNKHTLSAFGLALSLSCISIEANAATIDFESLASLIACCSTPDNSRAVVGHTYSEDGFTLNAYGNDVGGGWWALGPESTSYAGSIGLVNGDGGVSVDELVATDRSAFNMTSIDLATWNGDMTLTLEGLRPDNTIITESIFVPQETQHNYQTFQIAGMTGVTRVRWGDINGYVTTVKFDNIVVTPSAVPIPATAWLLGSGLIGLIGFAKRKVA